MEKEVILIFIANALFILGVYHAFSDGQIFGGFRSWYLRKGNIPLRIYLMKPFIGCFVCMPSIWGTLGYLLFTDYVFYLFPIYVFCLSGFMFLLKLTFFE